MSGTAYCKYCNKMVMIDFSEDDTEEEKETIAINCCECEAAKLESRRLSEVKMAKLRIDELFGDTSEELGFEVIDSQKIHDLMKQSVEPISKGLIKDITIKITSQDRVKITMKEQKIDVERTQTKKRKL